MSSRTYDLAHAIRAVKVPTCVPLALFIARTADIVEGSRDRIIRRLYIIESRAAVNYFPVFTIRLFRAKIRRAVGCGGRAIQRPFSNRAKGGRG
jgi:hypothetical protein